MIIYGSIVSPFVRKVMAFAAEKGVTTESRAGGMGRGGAEFAEASPFAKMPAIRDVGANDDGSDYVLSDSSAICHYLEAKYPDPRLIPAEARLRGEAIWFEEFADTILMGCGGKIFFNRVVAPKFLQRDGDLAVADAAERDELPPILRFLDARLAGREFLVAGTLTLADIAAAVPFANVAGAKVTIDPATYPNLTRWLAMMAERPSIAQAQAEVAQILAAA